jgi:hypothetical protein
MPCLPIEPVAGTLLLLATRQRRCPSTHQVSLKPLHVASTDQMPGSVLQNHVKVTSWHQIFWHAVSWQAYYADANLCAVKETA